MTQFLNHTDMQISQGIGKHGAAQRNATDRLGGKHKHLADWLPASSSSENTKQQGLIEIKKNLVRHIKSKSNCQIKY